MPWRCGFSAGDCSKFTDWLRGAVSINRRNLDLLCDDDCGA
jgi:hypothetical protein